MTLNPHPQFPSFGVYVLKLHRDAAPEQGRLCGRVVHMASGDSSDFASAADLAFWIQQQATPLWPTPNDLTNP